MYILEDKGSNKLGFCAATHVDMGSLTAELMSLKLINYSCQHIDNFLCIFFFSLKCQFFKNLVGSIALSQLYSNIVLYKAIFNLLCIAYPDKYHSSE